MDPERSGKGRLGLKRPDKTEDIGGRGRIDLTNPRWGYGLLGCGGNMLIMVRVF